MEKGIGVLLPISSLPSNYGIGTLGKEAYKFVELLKRCKQNYWQVLPIGPTSYGDSPYQSFSSFAGNPYFIDLDFLVEDKLLSINDIKKFYNIESYNEYIDYGELYNTRFKILKIAFENRTDSIKKEVENFYTKNKDWLDDYSFFMSIKNFYNGIEWFNWPNSIKLRSEKGLNYHRNILYEEIEFWKFVQYLFYNQWEKLKNFANSNSIKIIGDLPIYCAYDSEDVWAKSKNFKLDDEGRLKKVAGCPPDAFSDTGQLWGNPIYDWDFIKSDDYRYWIERIKGAMNFYDIIRIDHFRGFESYWEVNSGDETAKNGIWVKGPGIDLFNRIKREFKDIEIIAEDLGYLTSDVFDLLEETGYPGMNVLQFAFDGNDDNKYLPKNQKENSVVYTGTHDNNTILGWANSEMTKSQEKQIRELSSLTKNTPINRVMIDLAYKSPAKVAIIPIQDLLDIGEEGRINKPSTLGTNWTWRMKYGILDDYKLDNKIVYRQI